MLAKTSAKLKMWRSIIVLLLFQIIFSDIFVLIIKTFIALKIISVPVHPASSILGTIIGTYLYGWWENKRHPLEFTDLYVDKLCLRTGLIFSLVVILAALIFPGKAQGNHLSFTQIVAMFLYIFIFFFIYSTGCKIIIESAKKIAGNLK